jgi:hypothetical protein
VGTETIEITPEMMEAAADAVVTAEGADEGTAIPNSQCGYIRS